MWDRIATLPLVIFVAFATFGLLGQLRAQVASFRTTATLLGAIGILCTITILVFAVQQAVLCLNRFLPIAREKGLLPRFVALANADCGLLLLLVGRAPVSLERDLPAVTLALIGTLGAITALAQLGRSFSIFPQARRLVIKGPYAIIRHPLYLMESVGFLGICLQFRLPWSLLIFLINTALMIWRVGFEEDILSKTFPGYAKYRANTWRLIPYVY